MFTLAEEWELGSGSNPCKFVGKHRESKRERFLTDEEFQRLNRVRPECRRLSVSP